MVRTPTNLLVSNPMYAKGHKWMPRLVQPRSILFLHPPPPPPPPPHQQFRLACFNQVRLQTEELVSLLFFHHPLQLVSSISSSMSATTTNLSPVSNKETKMKLRERRVMERPIRDTNRKRIKRCGTRTRTNPCGDSNTREEEEEKEGRWSELPYEILDMIVKRIYIIDLINLRAVCKSWRYYSLNDFQPLKISKVPWLMTLDDDDHLPSSVNKKSSCKLIDPTYKKTYTVNDTKIKEKKLYDMEVQESKCGWVLMSSQSSCQTSAGGTFFLLYTPFSTENNLIELPVLNVFNSMFRIATFSCAPSFGGTTTQQDDDCVFLAYNNSASGEVSISTFRRGDRRWRTQYLKSYFPLGKVRSVVYSQGVFYCPCHTGSIGTFNVDRDEWVVLEAKAICFDLRVDLACPYGSIRLLQQSDGEFLLVFLWIHVELWGHSCHTAYKLDRSEMIWKWMGLDEKLPYHSKKWLGLRNMGGQTLFLTTKGTSLAIELPKWKHAIFICKKGTVMYFKVPFNPTSSAPYRPCTKLYGSYDGQKQIWIEPPL